MSKKTQKQKRIEDAEKLKKAIAGKKEAKAARKAKKPSVERLSDVSTSFGEDGDVRNTGRPTGPDHDTRHLDGHEAEDATCGCGHTAEEHVMGSDACQHSECACLNFAESQQFTQVTEGAPIKGTSGAGQPAATDPTDTTPIVDRTGYLEKRDELRIAVNDLDILAREHNATDFTAAADRLTKALKGMVRLATGKKARKAGTPRPAGIPRGPSALDLATQVLAREGRPMHAKELADAVIAAGWVTTGLTPSATISASIGTEIQKKGSQARFAKSATEKGAFEHHHPEEKDGTNG